MKVTITLEDEVLGTTTHYYPLVSGGPDTNMQMEPIYDHVHGETCAPPILLGARMTFRFTTRADGEGITCYTTTSERDTNG